MVIHVFDDIRKINKNKILHTLWQFNCSEIADSLSRVLKDSLDFFSLFSSSSIVSYKINKSQNLENITTAAHYY